MHLRRAILARKLLRPMSRRQMHRLMMPRNLRPMPPKPQQNLRPQPSLRRKKRLPPLPKRLQQRLVDRCRLAYAEASARRSKKAAPLYDAPPPCRIGGTRAKFV